MKHFNALTFLLFFSLLTTTSFAQFTVEHEYPNQFARRIFLEADGEKYYSYSHNNQELTFYNSDHTEWKKVSCSLPANATFYSIDNVSQHTFKSDDLIEFVMTYSYDDPNSNETIYDIRILNENGIILLEIQNASGLSFVDPDGSSPMLAATNYITQTSHIYSLTDFSFLKKITNAEQGVQMVDLPQSGKKLYAYNTTTRRLTFYNLDFSIWKTVNYSAPSGYFAINPIFITENVIDNQPGLIIGMGGSTISNQTPTKFFSRIINEYGHNLLHLPDAYNVKLEKTGNKNLLLIHYHNTVKSKADRSEIFDLSSLQSLKIFNEGRVGFVDLDYNGPKFFVESDDTKSIEFYDLDFNFWKSIPLPIIVTEPLIYVEHVSDILLNKDEDLEIFYSVSIKNLYPYYTGDHSAYFDEKGDYIKLESGQNFNLQNKKGYPFKALMFQYSPRKTIVYESFGYKTATKEIEKSDPISIYPVPAQQELFIAGTENNSIEYTLIDLSGKAIKQGNTPGSQSIDVSNIPAGIYVLSLETSEKQNIRKKVIIQ